MTKYLITMLGNLCELFTIIYFLKDSYKLRFKKSISVPLFSLCVLWQFLNNCLFLGKTPVVAVCTLLFGFSAILLFKVKPFNTIIFSFTVFLLFSLPELLVGASLAIVFDIDISATQDNMFTLAIGTFVAKFISYAIVFFLKVNRLRKINSEALRKTIVWVIMLPIASVIIMVMFINIGFNEDNKLYLALLLFSTLMMCAANIAVFYIISKQNDLIEAKEKLFFAENHIHRQIIHYEQLYKYQTELRMFRHDTKNRLLSMMGILKQGDTEKAMQALQSNLDFIDEMNKSIVDNGNPVIDAVLQSKLYDASRKGITVKITTRLTDRINIDELELGIIVGNALDNAIEAVEKISSSQNKEILFNMFSSANRISISVKNPVAENVDTDKLSTTKTDRSSHGFGVQSIKTIAQKYDGLTDFTCENNLFTANINLANARK